ncbi:hypothetical protein GOV08_00590 [Candidatus Woesearchaeota archaeon]|nr:hypothetical protein [Candidatus Woesearchaeota archaeon]
MNPQMINEEPINMATLKSELDKIKKRDGELNFRAAKTEDYLNQNLQIKKKASEELYKKLEKLDITRIKEQHIHKIIDVMPATPEELKSILTAYTISLTQENLKKIVGAVEEFLPTKKK